MWLLSADITLSRTPGYNSRVANSNVTMQPLMRFYRCADDKWIMLMLLDPARYWPGLCDRLGRPGLVDDARFATVPLRAQNGLELYNTLSGIFAEKPSREWGAAFAGWDAPWEYIQTIPDVANDPQAVANDYLFDVEVSDGTKVKLVAGPVAFDGSAAPVTPRRAPLKGEHSLELLRELGLEKTEVDRLMSGGIVA